jgi:hypothetical protein
MVRAKVVEHLHLGSSAKKDLKHSRRTEFGELAQDVLQELLAALPAEGPPPPVWFKDLSMEDEEALTAIYLITLAGVLEDTAASAPTPLKTLDGVTRAMVRDAVIDAIQHPHDTQRGGRPQKNDDKCLLLKLVTVLEEPTHFHVAVKLSKRVVFLPFKMALRRRSGFASHWSTSHREFCSAVRYLTHCTDHKPEVDKEPLTWTITDPTGKDLDLYEESQEPFCANAYRKRREKAEMQGGQQKKGKRAPSAFTKLEFIALVVARSLQTVAAVLEYAQKKGSASLQAFVSKHQRKLQELLEDADQWMRAAADAAHERQSDWDLIQSLAKKTCNCGGGVCQWYEAADEFFNNNAATINRREFAGCLAKVIRHGPGKNSRVPLIAGATNASKSTVLSPTLKVFGFKAVVHRPSEKASMALTNVTKKGKRFIFWDEYRPVEYAARGTVPVGSFLSLLGGTSLEVQVSQSFQSGHEEIVWRRGAALTAKEEGLWDPLPCLPGLVPVNREDIRHMQSRVHQFNALVQVPGAMVKIPDCAESFCRWLLVDAAAFATSHVERPLRKLQGRALPPLPSELEDAEEQS